MTIKNVSGTKDLNPQQVEENNYLLSKLSEVYRQWGYQEVSPPKVENINTLTAGGGIKSNEIIKIVVDEPLGLRPEMTASIARAAATRFALKERPLRLWACGTIFKSREESDGKIIVDENLHSGVELIGEEGMEIEVELLYLLIESLKKLNIQKESNPTLLISHTSLIRIILEKYNQVIKTKIKTILTNYDLIGLDKLDIDNDDKQGLKATLELRGSPSTVIETLRGIYGDNNVLKSLDNLFNIIKPISKVYNINIQLDPTYQPHYNLYTGIVFQLIANTGKSPVVIARGGRYDDLVNLFGNNNKAAIGAGFSFSIDKIKKIARKKNNNDTFAKKTLIAYGPNKKIEDALEHQRRLHKENQIALIELNICRTKEMAAKLLPKRGCTNLIWIN